MARSSSSRWASQAALDSLLRFSPQRAALAQQIREARDNYGGTVRAARVTAHETQRSAQAAIPALAAIFSSAQAAQQPGATLVSQQLARPGVDPSLSAGAAAEVQTQIANTAKQGASAQSAMVDRGVRAREGAQFAQMNAQQVLAHTLQGLFEHGQSLSQEQGAFAQSEAEKLAHEAESNEQQERASERTAETSRANAQETNATSRANSKESNHGGKGKGGWATTEQHNSARDTIEKARKEAYGIRQQHHEYGDAQTILETPIKTKAFSRGAYAHNGLLKAGLDLAYFGGIGAGTAKQLHKEGFNVGKLGYPMYHPTPQGPSIYDVVRAAAGEPAAALRR